MVKRTVNAGENEPEQATFDIPSEREHLFQVTDCFTIEDEMGVKLNLDQDTVALKLEVVGGEEAGRTMLQRLSLDPTWKGFFVTRLFLKAIGMPHKGEITIDTDSYIGLQLYATVVHNKSKDGAKTYANIKEYNFDKKIEQFKAPVGETSDKKKDDIAWED